MVVSVLSSDDARTLIGLCQTGRLYDIERWISGGKSICVPLDCRRSPLKIAVESGFHSLVELLAKHADLEQKNFALASAVSCRDINLIELLLAHGADLHGVPFRTVLYSWDPHIIRLFLGRGADAITDLPFTHAFCQKIRTALGPYVEYKRAHPELAPELQAQADAALRHFCNEKNVKWVSLMMWAGADPRTRGPSFSERYEEAPEDWATALQLAAYCEDVEILKALKPDSNTDDLGSLLENAAVFGHTSTINFLLERGADPIDRPDGSSSALSACLLHLGWCPSGHYGSQKSRWAVEGSFGCLKSMIEHGARWAPVDQSEINQVRRALCQCEPIVTVEIIRLFTAGAACPFELVRELVRTPTMKHRLAEVAWHLARLKLPPLWEIPKQRVRTGPPLALLLRQYDRDKLYEQVWAEPMRDLAKRYGVSDVWLAKVCRWLRVPMPGRGYWAKSSAGHAVPMRPALPKCPRP